MGIREALGFRRDHFEALPALESIGDEVAREKKVTIMPIDELTPHVQIVSEAELKARSHAPAGEHIANDLVLRIQARRSPDKMTPAQIEEELFRDEALDQALRERIRELRKWQNIHRTQRIKRNGHKLIQANGHKPTKEAD